jgi:hypothetical protein
MTTVPCNKERAVMVIEEALEWLTKDTNVINCKNG